MTLPGVGRSRQGWGRRGQVLADVGDGQSLQQSLSTFSAHMRRLRLILAAATPASLALLDEVGSGAPLIHHTSHLPPPHMPAIIVEAPKTIFKELGKLSP